MTLVWEFFFLPIPGPDLLIGIPVISYFVPSTLTYPLPDPLPVLMFYWLQTGTNVFQTYSYMFYLLRFDEC